MATATEKTLKIRIVTQLSGEDAFKKLGASIDSDNAKINQFSTTLKKNKDGVDVYTHSIELASKSLNDLRIAKAATDAAFNNRVKNNNPLISENPLKSQIAAQNQLASAYAAQSRLATANLYKQLALEQSIRINGNTSLKVLQLKAAQDEQAVKEDLANKLNAIEEGIKNGIITKVNQAEKARVTAIKQAAREITQIRKATEAEESKLIKRDTSANIFKQETDKAIAEMTRRLSMEQSIRQHGAKSIETLELKSANEVIAIRERMAAKLLEVENRLRTGALGNRGQANLIRSNILKQEEREINQVNASYDKQIQALRDAANGHKNLFTHVGEVIGIYRIWNFTINSVVAALKAIPKIGIELESTQASLTATTGSTAGLASVMNFLKAEASRTGIAIGTLRETFRGFQASTSLAGESLQTTVNIFRDINTVVTSLHLPAEKASGIFNALAQIFNKSKVQSEELVKQLGNLIPGAFAAFAAANKAQFANSSILIEEMKKGTVFAHETVERFAEFLSKRFATSFDIASKGLNANIGRMNTSFTLLGETIYGLSSGALSDIVKSLTSFANYLTRSIEGTTNLTVAVKGLTEALILLAGAGFLKVIDKALLASSTIAATTGVMARLSGAGYLAVAALDKLKLAFNFLVNPYTIITGIGLLIYHFGNLQDKVNETARSVAQKSKEMLESIKAAQNPTREKILLDLEFDVANDSLVKTLRSQIKDEQKNIDELSKKQLTLGFSTKEAIKQNDERIQLLKESRIRLQELTKEEENAVKVAKEKAQIQNAEQRTLTNLTGVNPAGVLREQKLKELSFTNPVAFARENYLEIASSDLKGLSEKIEQYPKDIKILQDEIANLTKVASTATGTQLEETKVAIESLKGRLNETKSLLDQSINSVNLIYSNADKAAEKAKTKTEKSGVKAVESAHALSMTTLKARLAELKEAADTEVKIHKDKQNELDLLQKLGRVSLADYYSGLIEEIKLGAAEQEKGIKERIDAINAELGKVGNAKGDPKRKIELNKMLFLATQELTQLKLSTADQLRKIDEDEINKLTEVSGKTDVVIEKYNRLLSTLRGLKDVKDSKGKPIIDAKDFASIQDDLQNKIANEHAKPLEGLKSYNELIKDIISNTKDLGVTNSGVFDAALGGFNQLAGALDNLSEHLEFYANKQLELNDKKFKAETENAKELDPVLRHARELDIAEKAAEAQKNLDHDITKTKLAGISQMVGAAENMFKKESSAAKALHSLNVVLTGARLALDAKEIASSVTKTAFKLAEGASTFFAQSGWLGFAGVGAMLAVMAGLGYKAVGGVSKLEIPTDSGTKGTVLGDSEASSQSLSNVAGLLKDIHAKEYRELVGINQSVTTMAAGIQDAVASVFRGGGLDSVGEFTKTISRGWNAAVDPLNIGSKIPFLGKITDSVNEFLFGSKKIDLKALGIATEATKLTEIGKGVNPSQFQMNTITKKGFLGGLFGGNKQYDEEIRSALNPETTSIINKIFANAGNAIFEASKVFNNVFDDAINNYVLPSLKVDLKDLKGEDAAKKMQEAISTLLDTASGAIFESLKQFQQLGEGMFETVNRIVIDVSVVRDSLKMVNAPLKLLGLDAISVAEAIVTASGGIKEARSNFKNFFEKFFSDLDHQLYNFDNLQGMLQDMGMTIPTTREGWRSLTQEMLRGGVATANAAARLLELTDSADQFYKFLEQGEKGLQKTSSGGQNIIDKFIEQLNFLYVKFSNIFTIMSIDPTRTWAGFDKQMKDVAYLAQVSFNEALYAIDQLTASIQRGILDKTNTFNDLITTIGINTYQALANAKLSGDLNSSDWNKQFAAQRKLEVVKNNVKRLEDALTAKQKTRLEDELNKTVTGETFQDRFNRQYAALEKLQSLVQTKYDKELQLLTQTISAISGIQTHVRDLLTNESLSPLSNTQMLTRLKEQFELNLQAARGGDTVALGNVSSSLDAYLQAARNYYASSEQYSNIFNQATMEALSLSDLALTTEEKIETNTAKMVYEIQSLQDKLDELELTRQATATSDREALIAKFDQVALSFLTSIQVLVDKAAPGSGVDVGRSYSEGTKSTTGRTNYSTVSQKVLEEDKVKFNGLIVASKFVEAAKFGLGRGYSKEAIAKYMSDVYGISQGDTMKWFAANGFAVGGAFTNGVVSRPTLFNTAVMGEKGSEGILPLSNVGGILGVHANIGGSKELIAEVRALRQEVNSLRNEAKQHTGDLIAYNYDATNKAAQTIVKGTDEATDKLNWKDKSKPALV